MGIHVEIYMQPMQTIENCSSWTMFRSTARASLYVVHQVLVVRHTAARACGASQVQQHQLRPWCAALVSSRDVHVAAISRRPASAITTATATATAATSAATCTVAKPSAGHRVRSLSTVADTGTGAALAHNGPAPEVMSPADIAALVKSAGPLLKAVWDGELDTPETRAILTK